MSVPRYCIRALAQLGCTSKACTSKCFVNAWTLAFEIDLYSNFYFKVVGRKDGRKIKSTSLVPNKVDTTVNQVKSEVAMRPRGAYFFSPKAQGWIKVKF